MCCHVRRGKPPRCKRWSRGRGAGDPRPRQPAQAPPLLTASTRAGKQPPHLGPLGRAVLAGARWDTQTGAIAEARLKELTPAVPVVFIKAVPADRVETKNVYECPVYKTRVRGPTYVWTFNLKTKEKAAKWILAAVALLLQV